MLRRASLPLVAIAALAAPSTLVVACGGSGSSKEDTSSTASAGGSSSSHASSSSHSSASAGSGGAGGAAGATSSSSSDSSSSSAGSGGATSSTGSGGATSSSSASAGTGGGPADGGACNTVVTKFPTEPGVHVDICSPIIWNSNPPSNGEHYPIWAAFKTYTTPVPRGFYVHDLEHGAVVLLYNCPSGCDAEVAQLQALIDARPNDPLCVAPVNARMVLTPDPLIPTKFAASAWGYTLTADCVDPAAFTQFINDRYGMGTEVLCNDGQDVTAPDAGYPADCGEGTPDAGSSG